MADIQYCEWETGFPTKFYNFIASFETTGDAVELYCDAPVEIDWGEGKFLKYEAGVIFGYQAIINSKHPVVVRSSEKVKAFRFGSGVDYDHAFLECHIHKAFDLETAHKLCYRLEAMHTFSFFGTNNVIDFSSAWEDCIALTKFEGLDTTEAESFARAWKNCKTLTQFPSVYSRKANTMEEAWMGCTAMASFPVIGSENCIDFSSAWRGNVNLVDFPLIDVSNGKSFDHAWAYCINLLNFPQLDFKNAEVMDFAFAYNYKIDAMPSFNTKNASSFVSMFEKNGNLKCIGGINTTGILDPDATNEMFKDCCELVHPDPNEQSNILKGAKYVNRGDCYFDAGRSSFFARCITPVTPEGKCDTGMYIMIEVTGGSCEVNWGDGIFMPYNEGIVTGVPIESGVVDVRSTYDITQVKFISDTFTGISIKRGKTLQTCESMCENLTKLVSFDMLGGIKATNFNKVLSGCTALSNIVEANFSKAKTMREAFKNCKSLSYTSKEPIYDLADCTDFTSAFENCEALESLPILDTKSGEHFDYMFKGCTALKCIIGINTAKQKTTVGMFENTPVMARPNANERSKIMNPGRVYYNGGNCSSAFDMEFNATGEVTFNVDAEVKVDWGDGNYVTAGPGDITGTPTSPNAYVTGDITAISFSTKDKWKALTFYNADHITSFAQTFKDMSNLENFAFYGMSSVITWEEAFMNDTSLQYFSANDYKGATIFTGMFDGCTNLKGVAHMNTSDGEQFERMFKDCTSLTYAKALGIEEINTLKAHFDKNWKDCVPALFNCNTDQLDCTIDYQCSNFWNCLPPDQGGDVFACFKSSTMFEGWSDTQIPYPAERIAITSQAHWKDGEIIVNEAGEDDGN